MTQTRQNLIEFLLRMYDFEVRKTNMTPRQAHYVSFKQVARSPYITTTRLTSVIPYAPFCPLQGDLAAW
jgi:hypothetical protein